MIQVNSYQEAINLLEEGEILVYKLQNYKPAFLSLKANRRIRVFNENYSYSISYNDFKNLIGEIKLFIFEKENDIEIDPEFRNIRQ